MAILVVSVIVYLVALFLFWIYLSFSPEEGLINRGKKINGKDLTDFFLSYILAVFFIPMFLIVELFITIKEIFD